MGGLWGSCRALPSDTRVAELWMEGRPTLRAAPALPLSLCQRTAVRSFR